MKIETEVKYKINNPKEIKNKLVSLGFSCLKKISQEDYYYSPAHKSFAGTRKYYLRLRKNGKKSTFAYHVVQDNLQTKEWEVEIDDFNQMNAILKMLDFKIDCIVKKNRLVYLKNKVEIVVDYIKDLGDFIEIEYSGKINKEMIKDMDSLTVALNLKKKNLVSGLGYPDLLINKKKHDKN